jgi:hypothetical protein
MTDSEAMKKIDAAITALPQQQGGWRESIAIQLQYCADLLQNKVGPDRVEEINMGYLAVREFDGYETGSAEFVLTAAICEIDHYIKNRFYTYAQKVRHGMHKHS